MRSLILISFFITLTSCSIAPKESFDTGADEQLYVDAQHNFTVNHLQDWGIETIPVSSPRYHDNMVSWVIDGNSATECKMTIQVFLNKTEKSLTGLLEANTPPPDRIDQKKLTTYEHRLGQALQLSYFSHQRVHHCIAVDGPVQSYLVSLDCKPEGNEVHRRNFYDSVDSLSPLTSGQQ